MGFDPIWRANLQCSRVILLFLLCSKKFSKLLIINLNTNRSLVIVLLNLSVEIVDCQLDSINKRCNFSRRENLSLASTFHTLTSLLLGIDCFLNNILPVSNLLLLLACCENSIIMLLLLLLVIKLRDTVIDSIQH